MATLQVLAHLLQRYPPSQEVQAPLEKLFMSRNIATRQFEDVKFQKPAHKTVEWLLALVIDAGEFSDNVRTEFSDENIAKDTINSRYPGFVRAFLTENPCPCAKPSMPTPDFEIKKGLCGVPDDELALKDLKFPSSSVPRAESWLKDVRRNFSRAVQSHASDRLENVSSKLPSQVLKTKALHASNSSARSPHQRGLPPLSPPQASPKYVHAQVPPQHVNGRVHQAFGSGAPEKPSNVMVPPPFPHKLPQPPRVAELGTASVANEPGSPVVSSENALDVDSLPAVMDPVERIPSEIEPGSPLYEDFLLARSSPSGSINDIDFESKEVNRLGVHVENPQNLSSDIDTGTKSNQSSSAFDDCTAHDAYQPYVSPKANRLSKRPKSPAAASENGVVASPDATVGEEKSPFRAKVEDGRISFPFDVRSLSHDDHDLRPKLVAICDLLEGTVRINKPFCSSFCDH